MFLHQAWECFLKNISQFLHYQWRRFPAWRAADKIWSKHDITADMPKCTFKIGRKARTIFFPLMLSTIEVNIYIAPYFNVSLSHIYVHLFCVYMCEFPFGFPFSMRDFCKLVKSLNFFIYSFHSKSEITKNIYIYFSLYTHKN